MRLPIIFTTISIMSLFLSFYEGDDMLVACLDDNTFTGTTSTDWNTESNWTAGCVPGDGSITGTITIAANCVVGSEDASDYTFGTGSNLLLNDGITFTNNGTGTWSINQISGNGNYVGDFTLSGTIMPGDDLLCDGGLHPAFSEFNTENFTIYLDGSNVVIETTGLPDHTSPYWSNTTERCLTSPMGGEICTNSNTTENHPLFVEPTVTSYDQMAPGNIDDFNGSYSLTVPQNPSLASSSSSTGLGAIGMAVSGSVIYNDEEGPNVPLDDAVGSLDYTAAHTGPQSYHYHLETKAWSDDDDKLIGIISDGFFIYGRKCHSTGTYPTDLDASGGHNSSTQHCGNDSYHYHVVNELYLNEYYILFAGDYQGTPNSIQ